MDETELSTAWRDIYSGQLETGGSSLVNWGSLGDSLAKTATGLASIYGQVEIAKIKAGTPLYQYGPNGVLYREGVPVNGGTTGGTISPLLLLIIAGVAFVVLKD